jgi:hypothetical protein
MQSKSHAREHLDREHLKQGRTAEKPVQRVGQQPQTLPGPWVDLPQEPAARGLRQSAVLQMGRQRGNAFLARATGSPLQRQAETAPPSPAGPAETAAPTELSAGGSVVRVTPGGVEVSGGILTVNSALARFSGAVQTDTLIANSVVASSYTPGAGNIW